MKNVLIVLAVFFSFISHAQTKKNAQPKDGFEVFTQQLIDNIIFPEEYYLNGGVNLRIAVDSLSTVKLISVTPRNVDFFNEVKPFIESKDWVPATVDGVSKTSVITFPIKLISGELSESTKPFPPEGLRTFYSKLSSTMLGSSRLKYIYESYKVIFEISAEGVMKLDEIIPQDNGFRYEINKFLKKNDALWTPSYKNGKPISSKITLPIKIKQNIDYSNPNNTNFLNNNFK